jgi:hypothetical protein
MPFEEQERNNPGIKYAYEQIKQNQILPYLLLDCF